MHAVVGALMNANNFFIALYDDERKLINWPYWADELDDDFPDANEWVEFGHRRCERVDRLRAAHGRAAAALVRADHGADRAGRDRARSARSARNRPGSASRSSPTGRTVGVLVVQSYTRDVRYTDDDKDLLAFVGQHVGAALSRARAIEETRQRNAELALINSVQEALAGELDLQAIYERRRRQDPRGLRRAGRRHRGVRRRGRAAALPVLDRARRALSRTSRSS